jgi:trehalose 6-phosphate phosphatase
MKNRLTGVELRAGSLAKRLFGLLEEGAPGLLLLDYDGTLAPFREERDEAFPYPEVPGRLDSLQKAALRAGGAPPILVSGRPASEVTRLLGLDPHPEVWGCHGWERLTADGELTHLEVGEPIEGLLEEAFREGVRRMPDDRIEHKGAAVAAHFRNMPEQEGRRIVESIRELWSSIASGVSGLELRDFDGGLELRASGRDKGSVVTEILDSRSPDTLAAYLGDDLTDEDAFRAMRDRNGLSVLVRKELRETEADLWVRPPVELLEFLDRWLEAVEGASGRNE